MAGVESLLKVERHPHNGLTLRVPRDADVVEIADGFRIIPHCDATVRSAEIIELRLWPGDCRCPADAVLQVLQGHRVMYRTCVEDAGSGGPLRVLNAWRQVEGACIALEHSHQAKWLAKGTLAFGLSVLANADVQR